MQFNISLELKPNILNYVKKLSLADLIEQEQQAEEKEKESKEGEIVVEGEKENLKNSQKLINSFKILLTPEIVGKIDQKNKTISFVVPQGTNLKGLVPLIILSEKATAVPSSLVPQDFSKTVDYRVTAEDGSVQVYKVSASFATLEKKPIKFSLIVIIGGAIAVLGLIGTSVLVLYFKKNKKKKENYVS